VPLSEQLKPFSAHVAGSMNAISPQTGRVNHITSVVAACPLVPYAFFNWTSSVFKYQDPFGIYPRGDFGFGLYSAPTVNDPTVVASTTCAGGTTIGGAPSTFVGEP
jgi:hypothetical protein